MKITPKDVEEFRRIWQEEFKEDITPEEAIAQIGKLDALYTLLARPVSRTRPGASGASYDAASPDA
jgi:hypothetical protein